MPSSEQGIDIKRFSVVPRSLIFLFNNQNQVLLIKGSPEKHIWANKYNGLGGHIEPAEDILEGAYRELAEESGVKDLPIWLCGQILVTVNQSQGVAIFVFKGHVEALETWETNEGKLEWVGLNEIAGLPLVADLYALLPKVAAHAQGDPLIVGKYTYNEMDEMEFSFH